VLGGGLGVGRIHDLYAQDPAVANAIQRAVVASSRHGIPALALALPPLPPYPHPYSYHYSYPYSYPYPYPYPSP
jgi:hypothetical protein